jgi:hypothetical protein
MRRYTVSILCLLMAASPAIAQDSTKSSSGNMELRTEAMAGIEWVYGKGATRRVARHGDCVMLTNNNELAMMIPTRSREEWNIGENSFLKNLPDGVTAAPC